MNGTNYQTVADFETSGADRLSFGRNYTSNLRYLDLQANLSTRLGVGWRSEYDATFKTNGSSPTEIDVILPSGAPYHFSYFSSHWFLAYWSNSWAGWYPFSPRHDSNAKIAQSGTNWIVTDDNDTQFTFDSSGRLTTITYRDGYSQTLSYASGLNTSVTDSFGRQLTFTYSGSLLDTMTDPDGNVYHYTYTSKPLGSSLQTVVYPDSTPSPTDNPVITYLYEDTSTVNQSSLTGITDQNGHRYATWAYDSKGRVTLEEFAGGADHIAISYDDAHTQRTVTNGLGKQFLYSLSTVEGRYQTDSIAGQASTHTAASTVTYTHDSNGFLTALTDGMGNVTHYTNNSIGEETSRTEGYGTAVVRTINTTWDAAYHVVTQIQQPGLTTDYTYTSGKLTQLKQIDTTTTSVPYSTNGQTRIWSYTYSTAGLVHTIDGPLAGTGDTVTYTYNTDGSLASVTDQVSHTTTITSVNGRGQPLSSTDPNGVVTNYTYDKLGRLLTVVVDPSGAAAITTMTYNLAGEIGQIQAPDGSTLNYTYDNAHRLTQVTNGSGEKIVYTLNAMGGRTEIDIKTSGASIAKTQTAVFDELNRTLSAIGAASQTTAFTYDKNDNNLTVTDPRSKLYSSAFDALNRLYQQTDPNSFNTGIAYNGKDDVTAVTDARSNATSYVRDGFGDAIQVTSPDTGVTINYFNGAGRMTKSTDARGIETDYTYDNADRMLTRTFPASSAENVTYTYDSTAGGNKGVGRLTGISDGSGSAALAYNVLGQTSGDSRVIGANTYGVAYTYDNAGHVLTATYPSGRIVTFARDGEGRISGITTKETSGSSPVTVVSSVTYKPFGPLASLSFGNGVALTLTWDQDYQLTDIDAAAGATTIQDLTYGYDAAGNIMSIADNLTPGRSQSFTYDNLNRLVTASGLYGGLTFAYDGVGNRTTRVGPGGTDIYAYPTTSNRLSTVTTGTDVRSFTYLNNGSTSDDARDPANDYSYTFNNAARLVTAKLNGATVGSYVYNALEQRAAKIASGGTLQFVYDRAGHLIAEADASTGSTIREYIWQDDMPVALVDRSGASPVLYYIHADHLNRPQKITDNSASIVWDGVFDPFGNEASVTGTITNPLRFPGQYQDSETNLAQNWFRDYDSTIGRYAESDPVGSGLVSSYSYADNLPTTLSDNTGRRTVYVPYWWPAPFVYGSNENRALARWLKRSFERCFEGEDECEREWEEAREVCRRELSKPHPNRGLTGGYSDVERCARGHVSELCGGNRLNWRHLY